VPFFFARTSWYRNEMSGFRVAAVHLFRFATANSPRFFFYNYFPKDVARGERHFHTMQSLSPFLFFPLDSPFLECYIRYLVRRSGISSARLPHLLIGNPQNKVRSQSPSLPLVSFFSSANDRPLLSSSLETSNFFRNS